MNSEEIQRTIEGMLSVQLELQKSQLQFYESLAELRADISDFKEISQRHERRIEQLIGYSITQESDRLELLQGLRNLERRVKRNPVRIA